MTTRPSGRLLAAVAMTAALSACQTAREQETQVKPEIALGYLADKPAPLKKHFYVTLTQGKRNQVLNDMRLGLAAMEIGETRLAEELFDDVLGSIETVYADNEHAAKARQMFVKEAVKDFKGEPYERAMAYYYRGLLYLRAGDYDNARASFKGGFLQDSFAEEEQARADFGLLAFLQGWSSRCRGNRPTAEEDFKEFQGINDAFPLPQPQDNTLVLIETGSAPVKFGAPVEGGTKNQLLKIRRASTTESARVEIPASFRAADKKAKKAPAPGQPQVVEARLLEDVYRQAATRGGREFDSILQGKVNFKAATDTVGNAALVGAALAASYSANSSNREQQQNAAAAAGVLLLVGLMAKGVAAATEADADSRYWDNLPDRVHGLTLPLPEGVSSLPVQFVAGDGTVLRTKDAPVIRAGACNLAWVRGESALPWSPRAPYSAPPETMAEPVVLPTAEAPTTDTL